MKAVPRKSFSLTRARRSPPELGALDRVWAAFFAGALRAVVSSLGATMRFRTQGETDLAAYRRLGRGRLLFAMWHGDFRPIMQYARGQGIYVIVSGSPDGEI